MSFPPFPEQWPPGWVYPPPQQQTDSPFPVQQVLPSLSSIPNCQDQRTGRQFESVVVEQVLNFQNMRWKRKISPTKICFSCSSTFVTHQVHSRLIRFKSPFVQHIHRARLNIQLASVIQLRFTPCCLSSRTVLLTCVSLRSVIHCFFHQNRTSKSLLPWRRYLIVDLS